MSSTNIIFDDPENHILYGAHVPFNIELKKSLVWANDLNIKNIQIYLGSNIGFSPSKLSDNDIKESKEYLSQNGMRFFIHAPLTYNMAGSVKSKLLSFCCEANEASSNEANGNHSNSRCHLCPSKQQLLFNNMIKKGIEHELLMTSLINKKDNGGVIIHPGTFPDKNRGLKAIARFIDSIDFPVGSRLILENSSGSKNGSKLAENLDEIKFLIESTRNREHVGVCLDTAHMFGAGYYNIGKKSDTDAMFSEIENKIGIEKVMLFHLNDSSAIWNSKIDAHELIGQGQIWGKGNIDPLVYFMKKAKKYNHPLCLETTPLDINTIIELSDNL